MLPLRTISANKSIDFLHNDIGIFALSQLAHGAEENSHPYQDSTYDIRDRLDTYSHDISLQHGRCSAVRYSKSNGSFFTSWMLSSSRKIIRHTGLEHSF